MQFYFPSAGGGGGSQIISQDMMKVEGFEVSPPSSPHQINAACAEFL